MLLETNSFLSRYLLFDCSLNQLFLGPLPVTDVPLLFHVGTTVELVDSLDLLIRVFVDCEQALPEFHLGAQGLRRSPLQLVLEVRCVHLLPIVGLL